MPQVNRNSDKNGGSQGGGMTAGTYFRSLDHLSGSDRLASEATTEFPNYDPTALTKSSRRSFMKLAGASMALAGVTLTGCRRWPKEQIVAYSAAPRDRIPGVPEQYATTFELNGVAEGLLVTTFDGRPIKVEGNPDHPFAVAFAGNSNGLGRYGAADQFAQASVLEMYDPERSRSAREGKGVGTASTVEAFVAAARAALAAGPVAFLSTSTTSPSALAMWKKLSAAYPTAKWYEYEPLSDDNERDGTKLAFGRAVRPIYDFKTADVVVSLDADLLGHHTAHLRYAADWADRRRRAEATWGGDRTMSRVYVAESAFTNTGAVADERLGLKSSRVDAVARALAVALGVSGAVAGAELTDTEKAFVELAARDLKAAGKNAFVAVGTHVAPETQAVAHLINSAIASTSVKYVELPDAARPTHLAAITQLAGELKSGSVKGLIVLGGNPAYDAPADLDFQSLLQGAAFTAYHGIYRNETSLLSQWHVNEAHYLEAWGDARAFDGTVSLAQPMIEPLFGGKTKTELLAALAGEAEGSAKLIVRSVAGIADETAWKKLMQKGVIEGTGYPVATVRPAGGFPAAPAAIGGDLELRFLRSTVYDGRYANLGWLIELPDPMTKLTWDNALILSKKDADTLKLTTGDLAKLTVGGKSLEIAVFVLPGQPVGSAYVQLGFGRKAAGTIGNDTGFDTYALRLTGGFNVAAASVVKTAGTYKLATTQEHYLTDWVGTKGYNYRIGAPNESGKVIREDVFSEYLKDPRGMHKKQHGDLHLQLWDPPHSLNDPHAWGMAIDMAACTGCGACVVACQAENNIPTVGKHQILMHRAMHWIRIDRYFKHDAKADPDVTDPKVVFQPMMCVHCENAPCEQVCPVAATVHDTEGLNTMVYNRCIGTRYCANNCPYKVRRFNYFDYHSTSPREGLRKPWLKIPDQQQVESVDPIKSMVFNPDVTVRMRGVMEKCTYCTQRLQGAKLLARNAASKEAAALKLEGDAHAKFVTERSKVADGAVMTACQQACPTQAIWFGDINDRGARVVKWQTSPRAYDVLAELNTRPRTKYLGKLSNPALEPKASEEAHG